ncbi:type II toxin-antitoxin system RelE/ParE family toxin [Lactiplantibacillus daowaiensis]|uniref:Type II toxin-antitoxin system RelE/ParE family toxin n=1 Tax=Lactiplantibacillus daowaiensis TaxID=2559918 RepID=A0ABW1RYJ3_9LACO
MPQFASYLSSFKTDPNLFEIRSKQSTNIQRVIYFHFFENHYVITHAFTKNHRRPQLMK